MMFARSLSPKTTVQITNNHADHIPLPADHQTLCYNSINIHPIKQHYTAFAQRVCVVNKESSPDVQATSFIYWLTLHPRQTS